MAVIKRYDGKFFSLSHSIDSHPVDEHFNYHIHDSYELFCLVKGKVGYVVEGHFYKLRPGAILIMRSSEAHKLIVNESDEYERYVLNFRPEVFEGFSAELLNPYTERSLGVKNRYLPSEFGVSAVEIFEQIFKEAEFLCIDDAVKANISSLLLRIGIAFLEKSTGNDVEHEIISYINENLTSDISVKKIAEYIHLSPSQTSRAFKNLTGTSIYDYILSKRLILFQQKLSSGKHALEASQECGFHDYSSFYRLYKKRFGSSPTFSK